MSTEKIPPCPQAGQEHACPLTRAAATLVPQAARYLTPAQVAERLPCSEIDVLVAIWDRQLPAMRFGPNVYRLKAADVNTWAEKNGWTLAD